MKPFYPQLLSAPLPLVAEPHAPYYFLTERHLQVIWYEQKYFKNLVTSLARISHTISRQVGQDVAPDSSSNTREHCQIDKARGVEDEDGVTGCPNCPRECEKSGPGERITVLSPGIWNAESGPDFRKAYLRIGDREIRGDVEIHLSDENWYHHQHHEDSRYDEVVLHLSLWKPKRIKPVVTSQGLQISQAYLEPCLTIPPARIASLIDLDLYPYKKFTGSGKCAHALFRHLSEEEIAHFFRSAAEWRLIQKMRYIEEHISNRQLIVPAGVAMALGYKQNTERFLSLFQELLAFRNLPESQLFPLALGMCGFFDNSSQKKWGGSPIYSSLFAQWKEVEPTTPRRVPLRLDSIRPANHPIRRIFYLVKLLQDEKLFSLTESSLRLWTQNWASYSQNGKWKKFQNICKESIPSYKDPYWNTHYLFEKNKQNKPVPLVGDTLKSQIVINTLLPLFYSEIKGGESSEAFQVFYQSFREEKNSKIAYLSHRFFGDTTKSQLLRQSCFAQGSYQLHKDFCMHFEASCIGCPFVDRYKNVADKKNN